MEKTIVERNNTISQFLGLKITDSMYEDITTEGVILNGIGQYSEKWDALMPVWRKWITDAAYLKIKKPELELEFLNLKDTVSHAIIGVDINKAFGFLVCAIEWYNANK